MRIGLALLLARQCVAAAEWLKLQAAFIAHTAANHSQAEQMTRLQPYAVAVSSTVAGSYTARSFLSLREIFFAQPHQFMVQVYERLTVRSRMIASLNERDGI